MTLVRFSLNIPAADGTTAPAVGMLRFTPTSRRIITGTPDSVILPHPFTVTLASGIADVNLAPTASTWVWQVNEYLNGVPARTVHLQVPDMAEVDYPDLVVIDPATLTPAPSPYPAWVAASNLTAARTPEALFVGAVTRNTDGAPISAAAVWPDGTSGTYAGTASSAFPGSIDSYTITYGATRLYTQPTVTRDSAGNVTNQPAITEETL